MPPPLCSGAGAVTSFTAQYFTDVYLATTAMTRRPPSHPQLLPWACGRSGRLVLKEGRGWVGICDEEIRAKDGHLKKKAKQ